jgi:hypothetical protein
MAKEAVKTVPEVIARLGVKEIARLFDCTTQAVHNWEYRGWMPPDTYVALQRELSRRKYTAPPSLWQMRAVAD